MTTAIAISWQPPAPSEFLYKGSKSRESAGCPRGHLYRGRGVLDLEGQGGSLFCQASHSGRTSRKPGHGKTHPAHIMPNWPGFCWIPDRCQWNFRGFLPATPPWRRWDKKGFYLHPADKKRRVQGRRMVSEWQKTGAGTSATETFTGLLMVLSNQ